MVVDLEGCEDAEVFVRDLLGGRFGVLFFVFARPRKFIFSSKPDSESEAGTSVTLVLRLLARPT